MSPKVRLTFAKVLLGLSLLGWPITQFTVAKDEPPFVLGLSWAAIILTLLDIVLTADVRESTDSEESS